MTMPNEEANSLNWTREFLLALLDPKRTPRVPKRIRQEARRLVKHYPFPMKIEELYSQAHGPSILTMIDREPDRLKTLRYT